MVKSMAYNFDSNTIRQMDRYSKVAGAIAKKYPAARSAFGYTETTTPSSVSLEYALNTFMLHALQSAENPISMVVKASNGMNVDSTVLEHYERALQVAISVREQNEQYVSEHDISSYVFPRVNPAEIEEILKDISSPAEARNMAYSLSQTDCQSFANRQILDCYSMQAADLAERLEETAVE